MAHPELWILCTWGRGSFCSAPAPPPKKGVVFFLFRLKTSNEGTLKNSTYPLWSCAETDDGPRGKITKVQRQLSLVGEKPTQHTYSNHMG